MSGDMDQGCIGVVLQGHHYCPGETNCAALGRHLTITLPSPSDVISNHRGTCKQKISHSKHIFFL